MAEPQTEVIFCLIRMTAADGTVDYESSGVAASGPIGDDDRAALEKWGKAALGLPSYGQQNKDLIEQVRLNLVRIDALTKALTDAGVAVPEVAA